MIPLPLKNRKTLLFCNNGMKDVIHDGHQLAQITTSESPRCFGKSGQVGIDRII